MMLKRLITSVALISTICFPLSALADTPLAGLGQVPALKGLIESGKKAGSTFPTVPTVDVNYGAKETGISILGFNIGVSWNDLALQLSQRVIAQIIDSTVVWFQSGFDGGPAYVTDSKSYFGGIANGVLGDELNKLSKGVLCTPFQAKITIAIRKAQTGSAYSPQCTLSGIAANYNNFMKDFSQGGWDAFLDTTQNSANNPYGALANAEITINNKVAAAVNSASQEISWGGGFKSQTSCKKRNITLEEYGKWFNEHGPDGGDPPGFNPKADFGGCIELGDIQTPGATIKSHLDEALPANNFIRQITTADQFDKLLTAFGNGLLQRFVFKKNGGGLLGAAPSGSTAITENANNDTSLVCTPSTDRATMNETEVLWSISNGFDSNILADYTWSGVGIEGKTGFSVKTIYTTDGNMTASVIASTTKIDNLGAVIPGSSQARTIPCSKPVSVSKYRPLAVSCSAVSPLTAFWSDESVRYPTVSGVVWKASITGGSGDFSGIEWDGDQQLVPGTNNRNNSWMFPNRYGALNNIDSSTVSADGNTITMLHKIDLKGGTRWTQGEAASSVKIEKTKTSIGTPLTEVTLIRPYYKDGKNTQQMRANITVTDKDLSLPTVTVDCQPSFTLIDR